MLVPAVNERITIEEFVAWCHEGLRAAGVKGEILIVDSSTDATPELAVRRGRPGAAHPEARPGPGLHRLASPTCAAAT